MNEYDWLGVMLLFSFTALFCSYQFYRSRMEGTDYQAEDGASEQSGANQSQVSRGRPEVKVSSQKKDKPKRTGRRNNK